MSTLFDAPPAAPAEDPAERRLALAALMRVTEPDDAVLGELIARVGAVRAWELLRAGDRVIPPRLRSRVSARVGDVRPAEDLQRAADVGGRLVCPADAEWPDQLRALDRQRAGAIALWVRGEPPLDAAVDRAVAFVGSRAATAYGQHMADSLAGGVGDRDWATVSGGAVGVDAAAHRAAMSAGAVTVAVLACGVDVAYPPSNTRLLHQVVASGGLVVSEWSPGCAPRRHRFLVRNRVLAALSRGTVVVEAAVRSGALSTARWSQRLGLPTMAVPGPVTSAMSGGCHALLRETDAVLVTSAPEIVEVVGRLGDDAAPRPEGPVRVRDALGPEAQRVLEATPVRAYAHPDRIAATAGIAAVRTTALLNRLHAGGFVEASDAGFRLAAALRRRAAVTSAGEGPPGRDRAPGDAAP